MATNQNPTFQPVEQEKPVNKGGRPSLFSEELAEEICRKLHESEDDNLPLSLRAICREPEMPHLSTVMLWLKDKPDFSEQYARARELRKDALMDRLLSLADKAKTVAYGEPGTGEAGAKVTAYKLEIDTIKWVLSKEYARDYGDKITQEISGPNGAPLQTAFSITPEVEDQIKRLGAVRAEMTPPQGYEGPNPT